MANQTSSQHSADSAAGEDLPLWPAGGIPPADVLKRYEEIVPGAAQKIVQMFEEEAKHRQALEMEVRQTSMRFKRYNVILSSIVIVFSALAALGLFYHGADIAAVIIGLFAPASMGLQSLARTHFEKKLSRDNEKSPDSAERSGARSHG